MQGTYYYFLNKIGHSDRVSCVKKLSSDLMVSASSELKFWKYFTGECVKTLKVVSKNENITSLEFLPDIQQLAIGSRSGIIFLDVESKIVIKRLKHYEGVICLKLLTNGKQLASAGSFWDKSIKLWDLNNDEFDSLKGSEKSIYDLEIIRIQDREYLASCCLDGSVKIYDCENKVCVKMLSCHDDSVNNIRYLTRERLATCSSDNTIKIYDLKSEECIKTLESHENDVICLKFGSTF